MRKPGALQRGDLIGVVSPGAAVDEERAAAGVAALEKAGFQVHVARAALSRSGYLAGSDADRLADLHDMFVDPAVKAIFTTRGGYGSGRLLPHFDLDAIALEPKIFVGHSDITFLLNHFCTAGDFVTFHGPLVAGIGVRDDRLDHLLQLLQGEEVARLIPAPVVIQPGVAEGPLMGGCLAILTAMLGTPYFPTLDDCVLFLEDTNEKPFRIDRMLVQLRQAGVLDRVAAVVFGEMDGCTAGDGERISVRDVVTAEFIGAPYPVLYGLSSGHGAGLYTLPLGVQARVDESGITVLESPVEVHAAP